MTTKKNTPTLGRIRMSDDSMTGAGIRKGDLALVTLGAHPVEGKLVAAFTAAGELVVRNYHKEADSHIRLTRGPRSAKSFNCSRPTRLSSSGLSSSVEKGGAK